MAVSMPFKRAVVLLAPGLVAELGFESFQCPLSGQLCCWAVDMTELTRILGFNAL